MKRINRKGAKDAKKKEYKFFIAGFTPITQKRFNGAGSNKKASSLPCTYLGLRL
jgi:hypothetical protein